MHTRACARTIASLHAFLSPLLVSTDDLFLVCWHVEICHTRSNLRWELPQDRNATGLLRKTLASVGRRPRAISCPDAEKISQRRTFILGHNGEESKQEGSKEGEGQADEDQVPFITSSSLLIYQYKLLSGIGIKSDCIYYVWVQDRRATAPCSCGSDGQGQFVWRSCLLGDAMSLYEYCISFWLSA